MPDDAQLKKRGQRLALLIAGVAVFWWLVSEIGRQYDWSHRVRGLFDLMALAGFGVGIWMSYQLWRDRQADKDG